MVAGIARGQSADLFEAVGESVRVYVEPICFSRAVASGLEDAISVRVCGDLAVSDVVRGACWFRRRF